MAQRISQWLREDCLARRTPPPQLPLPGWAKESGRRRSGRSRNLGLPSKTVALARALLRTTLMAAYRSIHRDRLGILFSCTMSWLGARQLHWRRKFVDAAPSRCHDANYHGSLKRVSERSAKNRVSEQLLIRGFVICELPERSKRRWERSKTEIARGVMLRTKQSSLYGMTRRVLLCVALEGTAHRRTRRQSCSW